MSIWTGSTWRIRRGAMFLACWLACALIVACGQSGGSAAVAGTEIGCGGNGFGIDPVSFAVVVEPQLSEDAFTAFLDESLSVPTENGVKLLPGVVTFVPDYESQVVYMDMECSTSAEERTALFERIKSIDGVGSVLINVDPYSIERPLE